MSTFNARVQKSRMSAGWSHDRRHYSFMRQHDSRAPFVESQQANTFADALLGVVCFVALIGVLLFVGAY